MQLFREGRAAGHDMRYGGIDPKYEFRERALAGTGERGVKAYL